MNTSVTQSNYVLNHLSTNELNLLQENEYRSLKILLDNISTYNNARVSEFNEMIEAYKNGTQNETLSEKEREMRLEVAIIKKERHEKEFADLYNSLLDFIRKSMNEQSPSQEEKVHYMGSVALIGKVQNERDDVFSYLQKEESKTIVSLEIEQIQNEINVCLATIQKYTNLLKEPILGGAIHREDKKREYEFHIKYAQQEIDKLNKDLEGLAPPQIIKSDDEIAEEKSEKKYQKNYFYELQYFRNSLINYMKTEQNSNYINALINYQLSDANQTTSSDRTHTLNQELLFCNIQEIRANARLKNELFLIANKNLSPEQYFDETEAALHKFHKEYQSVNEYRQSLENLTKAFTNPLLTSEDLNKVKAQGLTILANDYERNIQTSLDKIKYKFAALQEQINSINLRFPDPSTRSEAANEILKNLSNQINAIYNNIQSMVSLVNNCQNGDIEALNKYVKNLNQGIRSLQIQENNIDFKLKKIESKQQNQSVEEYQVTNYKQQKEMIERQRTYMEEYKQQLNNFIKQLEAQRPEEKHHRELHQHEWKHTKPAKQMQASITINDVQPQERKSIMESANSLRPAKPS